jgi:hypothetical protein
MSFFSHAMYGHVHRLLVHMSVSCRHHASLSMISSIRKPVLAVQAWV